MTKNKIEKAAGFAEIPSEIWKTRKFDNFFGFTTLSINKIQ